MLPNTHDKTSQLSILVSAYGGKFSAFSLGLVTPCERLDEICWVLVVAKEATKEAS
jgi:hypothetical protein